MSFPTLQNGLYNFIMEALGMTNANNLQLIQPAVPFPAGTKDATVWNWMNELPPFALSQSGSGGAQYFSNYQTVMSALKPSVAVDFAGDIGSAAYNAWLGYLASVSPAPTPTQQASLFFNWAFSSGYYSVAETGASDLSTMILEPVLRAKMALLPYTSIGTVKGKPFDFSQGYSQLVSQLNSAPNRSLSSTNVQSNSNVSSSWAASSSGGGFLLWGGGSSSSAQSISESFASAAVSVTISFEHALTFVSVPGVWYDSGAFGLAYGNQTGLPWNSADTAVTWQKTFGSSGSMQRFASSLIVVSGMKLTASSAHAFSSADQTTINQNSGGGFWPFYSSGSSSSFTSSHSFNKAGNLTITQNSVGNVPTLLGMIVLPAATYLGHAVAGHTRFLNLASALNVGRLAASL